MEMTRTFLTTSRCIQSLQSAGHSVRSLEPTISLYIPATNLRNAFPLL